MFITGVDYLLLPLYLLFMYLIVRKKAAKYGGTGIKKYFIGIFFMHIFGSILHSIVLQYYYKSGDAFIYFEGGEFIKKAFLHSGSFFKVFFMNGDELYEFAGAENLSLYARNSLIAPSSLSAIKFSGFFSLFSFSHFLINALFCGFISFVGTWKFFTVFNDISKGKFQKKLAILITFTPTIWFWGSGMGKDSISFGLLGILIGALYGLIKRKKTIPNLLIILTVCYLLLGTKGALLGLLAASASGYIAVYILNKTKNLILRLIVILLFLSTFTVFFISSLNNIQDFLDDIKNMVESNIATYSLEAEGSEGAFEPPEFTFTPAGIAAAIPKTVFSTLYRPFIWEVRKPIMFFSALESLLMMFSFLYVLFKVGIWQFIKTLFTNPAIMFCFIFCTLMAMIVGFTTFNLGTLVRYRLPLLPFYIFMILAFWQAAKEKKAAKALLPA